MTRSQRLALEGKIEVYIGSFELARVITSAEMSRKASALRYIGTDRDTLHDARSVSADVYEDIDGNLYAVIN